MDKFNSLYKKIIENNTAGAVLGTSPGQSYAGGDNRPIVPANIVIGSKKIRNKKRKIPVQRRSFVEPIIYMSN